MYFNIGNNKIKMANIYYTKDTFLSIRYFTDNIISLQCNDVLFRDILMVIFYQNILLVIQK